jgi:uncharacterized protein DUF899
VQRDPGDHQRHARHLHRGGDLREHGDADHRGGGGQERDEQRVGGPGEAGHRQLIEHVSRAPLEKLQSYKQRMGWNIDWVSTAGSDFNRDLGFAPTEEELRPFLEG